jgi:hypothetical protein
MSRPRPLAVLVLLLSASFAWLFRGALFKDETFVERDLATFHRAAKSLVPRLVHEAHGLPQWNPYYASGQPFAANPQHALFHPATALFLVLPFEWAFRLQVMLPPVVAAAAMFFLLRSLGRRRGGAAFGALVWGLGGDTLSVTNLLPTLLATSVLPAVLSFAHRIARGGGRKNVAGLALASGLEALAGEPAILLVTPLLLIPAVGQALLRRPRGWSRLAAGRLVLGLVLGGCLAGATLLPASRLAARTTRADGLAPAMADIWSMPPFRLAEVVFPYAFGRVEAGAAGFWALRFYPGQSTPFIYSLYPGLLTTVLAAMMAMAAVRSPGRLRSRPALLWIGAGLAGVALAAGRYLPFWPVLRHVPPFSGVRYPERFVLVALLPLVILAAWGFDLVVHSAAARRTTRALLFVAGGLSAAAGAFALGSPPRLWVALGLPEATAATMRLVAAQDAVTGLITALAFLFALDGLRRRWPWASTALVALAALDLVHTGGRLMKTRPAAEMTAPPPVIRDLLAASVEGPVFHAAGWAAQREREFSFVRPPMPAFWGIATAFEPDFDLTELRWSSAATRAFLEVLGAQPPTALAVARRRGVVAVIRFASGVQVVGGMLVKPEGAESAVELRLLDAPRPLAFLASRVEAAPGETSWRDTVLRLGPASADTLIVDSSDAARVPAHPSPGPVRIRERAPGRIVLDLDAQGPEPGLVAVNQTWDPFWRARVDGGEAVVLRTDLSLMGVVVPPGRHRLELTYEDPWVRRGLAVSACALVGLAALAWPRARRPGV